MKISTLERNNNSGFTLIELVIVIAGLATLTSFSIPNFLNSIKLNKIEEVKALMNGYASDCLGKSRVYDGNNLEEYLEEISPYDLDNERLSTLGYRIDGDKSKCSNVAVKPLKDNEKDLFAFDFSINDGLILKTGTPSNNPRFLNSCKGWAGKNCGLSDAQKAEFARLKALAKAKSNCEATFQNWLGKPSSGEFVRWDDKKETCTSKVWAFEGRVVNSAEAVEQALKNKYGQACLEWRQDKIKRNSTSSNGKPETIDPECGGVVYWFHSGKEFNSKSDWIEYDNKVKKQTCENDRNKAIRSKKSGKYTYGPTPGPSPCGKTVWFCKGIEYTTNADYLTTSCGTPPKPPKPPKRPTPPKRCKKSNICRFMPSHPVCTCR